MKLKKFSKLFLIASILLVPVLVFASTGDEFIPITLAIGMELFVSLHMSMFVFAPLANIFSKNNSKKVFWTLFSIRAILLLFFDFFVTTEIALVDFIFVFIGTFIVVPIAAVVLKVRKVGSKQVVATDSTNLSVGTELKCLKCNSILSATDKFCPNCGEAVTGSNTAESDSIPVVKKNVLYPSNFDNIYSLSDDKMLEAFIEKELKMVGMDTNTRLVPQEILNRRKIFSLIFSVLLFIYISMIFFHFPLLTYVIGIIILVIFYVKTKEYNIIKYLKREVKARPSEKISNIIMNAKTSLVTDNQRTNRIVITVMAFVIPLIIFMNPHIMYEKMDSGYGVRFYTFGLLNMTNVTIPSTHDGEPVVSLRGNTFSNMPILKKVTLPDTIKEIRGQAFKNNRLLKEVNIPSNLEYLGGGAFYNCTSIKEINLPDSLTYLGGESFKGASLLQSINLSNNLTEIRGNTFEECTSLKSINIPDKVTRIGGHAFYGDYSLSQVTISQNSKLREIGSSAFRKCESLSTITIPSATYVNERAFKESPTSVYRYENSYDGSSTFYYDH